MIIQLWDAATGNPIQRLEGHEGLIWSVAFSPKGNILASSSDDETIRLWSMNNYECIDILQCEKPYEKTNITNIKGLTESQISSLKELGAIED